MLSNNEHVANLANIAVKLLIENTELKRQIETNKIQKVSSAVAVHIDKWLNQEYHCSSEQEDIEKFSKEITTFIHNEMKN
ncbi:hypothetical protein [Psychrobacillus antarcticus]|uniref:hypothetical protein n=1 Tax=Psychrobacillus antarcticus TaxID=2879115 RepID=UPI002408423B|nr:hypothetical protein [Psychrobacillus antarcticus]